MAADESTPPLALNVERALARLIRLPWFTPRLDVVRLDVLIPTLPDGLVGFRLAHLSDFHVGGKNWGPMRHTEAAATLRAEGCDLQVNTGDFVRGSPPLTDVVAAVRATLPSAGASISWPSVAVLGNHDYYAGEEVVRELSQALDCLGVCLLTNQVVQHRHRAESVTLAGLVENEPGFGAAIKELLDSPRPRIVLVHEPDLVERLPANCADLILAGHTHGGQIALPVVTPWIVRHGCGSRYVAGQYHVNGNLLYINRGLGCTGYPVRFRAAPELTFLRLVR